MSILAKIDKAICLTLDKRYEMALELQAQFKPKGIDVELFIAGGGAKPLKYDFIDSDEIPPRDRNYSIDYPTWYARPNAFNAWKCHREIFLRAKGNLLLLEDDSVLSDDFDEILANTNEFLSVNPWDMVYFGCYQDGKSTKTSHPNVLKLGGAGGFHGVLMNQKIIKNLLNWPPYGPYDWITGTYLHQYYNCYAIYPCIINQRSGFSFVENCNLEKPPRDLK